MATRLIAMACWHVNISFNRFRKKNVESGLGWVMPGRFVAGWILSGFLENSRIAKAMMRKYYNMF